MRWRDAAELVRLPAALTVPGDTLAGAAAAGRTAGRRGRAMPLASVCFYLAGMALNDWADRELDAVERPERPIPSGRVAPGEALALAAGLTGAGLGIAAAAGGRRALRVAAPLAATVWAYDLLARNTPAGPAVMALARGLDVLLGAAGGGLGRAALPAVAVAGHTAGVTLLSRGEVHGADPRAGRAALLATGAAAALAALPRRGRPARSVLTGAALAAGYAATVGRAQLAAALHPDPVLVRGATGAGVRGVIPLQAALVAGSGAPATAALLAASAPAARLAAKVVSPT
ncbi:SCO3242 family prenyltransferase [Streptomyces aidingensis]|uniref:4-hydroxybenzoate polyprenyltransferase n=1 Tax=Streptomyces aidingensis TaxID=910347 RepID=A0A1I1F002_9ACTN|nr:UbiA family prenyltransferase [Streptomyces aidingensis]SFB92326.1 4-hydroxybenzoate polyprenyltransferase [Streptomyces aidingensis]